MGGGEGEEGGREGGGGENRGGRGEGEWDMKASYNRTSKVNTTSLSTSIKGGVGCIYQTLPLLFRETFNLTPKESYTYKIHCPLNI